MWIGEGVEIDDVEGVEGPAFIGNYCTVSPESSVGPYTVLGPGTTLRERARVSRSVIDASCYIGRSVTIEGAILGRNCDVRPHARVHEGVAVGDQVTLGDQSVIFPGVRIYPYKEVEYGAQIHESLIWESRGTTKVFAQDGVVGLVNVDLTPEVALRVGAALGTALKRGARVVASRESAPAYRMIKRALISGLNSTGVQVADLRTLPAPVGKHLLKTQNYDAAFHVGASTTDPEAVQIRLFERPGVALSEAMQKEIEKHFTRQELRRVPFGAVGSITYPARARESYASDLVDDLDVATIRERGFRIVVDYGYSGGSFILPLVFGQLGVEAVTAHAFESDVGSAPARFGATLDYAQRLVEAVNADFGAVFDRSAERLFLIDETGREVRPDQALLLYLHLLTLGTTGKIAVPITATSQVEEVVGDKLDVIRTPATLVGPDGGGGRRRRHLRGRAGRGVRVPGLPARLRRERLALQAARAARARRAAALEARRRAAAADADPSPAAVSLGAERDRHARPQRALRRRQRRPARRDQDLRRARLGPGAAGRRRAARPPLRRG